MLSHLALVDPPVILKANTWISIWPSCRSRLASFEVLEVIDFGGALRVTDQILAQPTLCSVLWISVLRPNSTSSVTVSQKVYNSRWRMLPGCCTVLVVIADTYSKSKNHTNHNQNKKAHRNGIKKPKTQKHPSMKGVDPKFRRNLKYAQLYGTANIYMR